MPKVSEIDFKTGAVVPSEPGQPEKTEEPPKAEAQAEPAEKVAETEPAKEKSVEEQLKEAQERLKKVEEDKENYKKGMLKYKDLSLKGETKEEKSEPQEDYPEWDENSKKFQKQTILEAEKRAEAKAKAYVEESNEKAAIEQFVNEHPDVVKNWKDFIPYYSPSQGKMTVKAILKDLNRTYVSYMYERGELDKMVTQAREEGKKEGKIETRMADMASVSKTTQKTAAEGKTLSTGAIKLAEAMRVNQQKLAAEDDSLSAEIKL